MNTFELKSDLHDLIDQINDTNVLSAIRTLLTSQTKDVRHEIELPSEIKESVKRGMDQARIGKTKDHSEIIEKYEKWL